MFHNAYIVLIIDEDKSSGEEYNNGSKILEPIAGVVLISQLNLYNVR